MSKWMTLSEPEISVTNTRPSIGSLPGRASAVM